jgi:hypothetical protein
LRAIQNYHNITQFYQEEDKPIRTKKIDRDLSEDEIQREMQRVREEMNKKRLSSSRPIEQVASTSIASASTPSNVNSIWSIPGISEHTPKSTASQPNIWGAVQSSSQSSTNNSGWAAF